MSTHNKMPFYFRKLKRALRLLPSTQKSLSCINLSFSTRTGVNERDNGSLVENCSENSTNHLTPADKSIHDAATNDFLPIIVVPPSFSLNLTQNDICKYVLTGSTRRSSLSAIEDSYLTHNNVKSLSLTTDDILVNPGFGCPFNYDLNISISERIPVDVITAPAPLPSCTPVLSNHAHDLAVSLSSFLYGNGSNTQSVNSPSNDFDSQSLYNDISSGSAAVKNENFLFFSSTETRQSDKLSSGPTPEQLLLAREKCMSLVEGMLSGSTDQSILHKDVILENNLFGKNKVSKGVTAYYLEILKLRIQVHARQSKATMDILNVSTVEQTGVIRIHWRMTGISQLQVVKFWRFLSGSEIIEKDDKEWFEAFSYFHIGKDGLVYKHRMDRTLPDNGGETSNLKEKLQNMLNPAKPLVS